LSKVNNINEDYFASRESIMKKKTTAKMNPIKEEEEEKEGLYES
jgi:hypothetical protein